MCITHQPWSLVHCVTLTQKLTCMQQDMTKNLWRLYFSLTKLNPCTHRLWNPTLNWSNFTHKIARHTKWKGKPDIITRKTAISKKTLFWFDFETLNVNRQGAESSISISALSRMLLDLSYSLGWIDWKHLHDSFLKSNAPMRVLPTMWYRYQKVC